MHDLSELTAARISAVIIGFLLLVSMPVLFRKPASTMSDIGEIAIHAFTLSLSDSVWSGGWWMIEGIEPPLPGCVAFGTHDYYPYKFFTARDVRTGDVLIRITSPLNLSSNADFETRRNFHFTAVVQDTDALVIIRSQNSESWPVRLFSIMTSDQ